MAGGIAGEWFQAFVRCDPYTSRGVEILTIPGQGLHRQKISLVPSLVLFSFLCFLNAFDVRSSALDPTPTPVPLPLPLQLHLRRLGLRPGRFGQGLRAQ